MSTTLTIGGASVDPAEYPPVRAQLYNRGGVPTLTIQRRGGALPGLPDPWLGKAVVLAIGGTTVFAGDACSIGTTWDDRLGWILAYQCLGLRNRADYFPLTNDNDGMDRRGYNLQPDDPAYLPALAGRTVGQVLTDVLTSATNSGNAHLYGLGAYTALGPPATLPAATIADLAALTMVPPTPVTLGGEKFGGALESFLDEWAPNHFLWIDPATGAFRVLDQRTFTASTLTLGTDPVDMTELARDVGDCYQRVLARGQPWVEPFLLTVLNGGLAEDFAHDGLTNTAAKAAWTPANFSQSGTAEDHGTCTCPTTLTVTVTSANTSRTWASNAFDQTGTGAHGVLYLVYGAGTTITQYATRRIVSHPALTAGGTCTLTLDLPLPITSYDSYSIRSFADGSSIVWRKYSVVNSAVAAAMQSAFPYPVPYCNASGSAAALTSVPTGSVVYGTAPYNEFPLSFQQDPTTGTLLFSAPTWRIAGNAAPHDVRALLAIATGVNRAVSPADVAGVAQFEGTSHAKEGLGRTLIVTIDGWRDPINAASMLLYTQDLLDSVKDAVIEGTVTYNGLYSSALTPGIALNVAGNGYTTGWETPLTSFTGGGLPVVAVDLEWSMGGATDYITTMHCSNRRQHYGQGAFLRPPRSGLELGGEGGFNAAVEAGMFAGGLGLTSGFDIAQGLAHEAIAPDLSALPTSVGDLGLPAGPADLGLPTAPADMGLPTTAADLGLPTSVRDVLGGGEGATMPDDDNLRARVARLEALAAAQAAKLAELERRILAIEQGQSQAWQSQ